MNVMAGEGVVLRCGRWCVQVWMTYGVWRKVYLYGLEWKVECGILYMWYVHIRVMVTYGGCWKITKWKLWKLVFEIWKLVWNWFEIGFMLESDVVIGEWKLVVLNVDKCC